MEICIAHFEMSIYNSGCTNHISWMPCTYYHVQALILTGRLRRSSELSVYINHSVLLSTPLSVHGKSFYA